MAMNHLYEVAVMVLNDCASALHLANMPATCGLDELITTLFPLACRPIVLREERGWLSLTVDRKLAAMMMLAQLQALPEVSPSISYLENYT
jgi:hypothetical protein